MRDAVGDGVPVRVGLGVLVVVGPSPHPRLWGNEIVYVHSGSSVTLLTTAPAERRPASSHKTSIRTVRGSLFGHAKGPA